MNQKRGGLLLISGLIVSVSIMACNELDSPLIVPEQDFIPAALDEQFQLKFGQTTFIHSENIKVRFLDVTGDSRCPSDVVCIWEGQVEILVNVLKNNQDLGDLTLVNRAGNDDLATQTFDGYSIKLAKVEPYPISTQKIELSDYVITLVVTKV